MNFHQDIYSIGAVRHCLVETSASETGCCDLAALKYENSVNTNVQKFAARSMQFQKRAVWPCPSAAGAGWRTRPWQGRTRGCTSRGCSWQQQQLCCSRVAAAQGLLQQEQPGQAPPGSIQGAELAIQPGKPGLHPLEPSAAACIAKSPKCHTVQPRLKAILDMNLKAGNKENSLGFE